MNRRNFITTLSAVTAASIFLPRAADAFKWRRSSNILHLNAGYASDGDAKQVFITKIDGKRIDFFFLK